MHLLIYLFSLVPTLRIYRGILTQEYWRTSYLNPIKLMKEGTQLLSKPKMGISHILVLLTHFSSLCNSVFDLESFIQDCCLFTPVFKPYSHLSSGSRCR